MKAWEFDVEVRVRKTLTFSGPDTEEAARYIFAMALSGAMEPATFIKWTESHPSNRQVPIEEWIDDSPQLVAVREVTQ